MSLSIHGVFLKVFDTGVLITGPSGIGKSELALGLIHKKHQLIADDQVIIEQHNDTLIGRAPSVLQDFLEVRGLGVLDMRALFGEQCICSEHELQLILDIDKIPDKQLSETERLTGIHSTRELLDIAIPVISIPVVPGRHMAIIAETAVRDFLLKLKGYNACEVFLERQKAQMLDV